MAWDGHLAPGITCKRCGVELQGAGSGRPAESYAGTYNGLCYPCTGASAFKVEEFQYVSGAWKWDHPPYSPSWRRTRETYIAFGDCLPCRGKGRKIEGGGAFGGHATQCKACYERHQRNPLVAAIRHCLDRKLAQTCLLNTVATRVWHKRLKAAECPLDREQKGRTPEQEEITQALQDQVQPLVAAVDGDSPIAWPKGMKPTKGDRKKVVQVYDNRLSTEELAELLV